jgi:translation initiation factor 4G
MQATSAARGEERKKPRGEVIKYPRDFLMKFAAVCCTLHLQNVFDASLDNARSYSPSISYSHMQTYTQVPTELQFNNVEILLDPSDPEREAQRQLLQRVAADDDDERDWRSRTPLPPTAAGAQQTAQPAAPADPNAPKIQRATDIGRTAWAPATATAPTETAAQALRKVKGILNKLTPEKFERLLGQLIPLISSYEVLQGTIVMVFENAVVQPTFVAMYADLCSELDAALPEFEGPDGPQQFKKMLANTCQEEYEATEEARAEAQALSGDAREDGERKAKQRLLGNVRLIAELFKKGMVNDRIMVLILSDLLGPAEGQEPSEDSLEAACEVIGTAGAALEETQRSKTRLDNIFAQLGRLANSRGYAPRIRFVIRDVIDLRSQHWVARRETFTAKKLDEIRSDAQAELGIVDVTIPGLEPLPGMDALPGIAGKRPDDVELFPAFKGADMKSSGAGGEDGDDGKFSAFLGEFVPLPDSNAAAAADAETTSAPEAPRYVDIVFKFNPEDGREDGQGKGCFLSFSILFSIRIYTIHIYYTIVSLLHFTLRPCE